MAHTPARYGAAAAARSQHHPLMEMDDASPLLAWPRLWGELGGVLGYPGERGFLLGLESPRR